MTDKGPNYKVERMRLEVTREEHEATIAKGQSRIAEIERQKELNTRKTVLANAELDVEAATLQANEEALQSKIAEIDTNLSAMVKT